MAPRTTISPLMVGRAEVVMGFGVLLAEPLPAAAPIRPAWSTLAKKAWAYETLSGVVLQEGENVPLDAAATPASSRTNATTYAL